MILNFYIIYSMPIVCSTSSCCKTDTAIDLIDAALRKHTSSINIYSHLAIVYINDNVVPSVIVHTIEKAIRQMVGCTIFNKCYVFSLGIILLLVRPAVKLNPIAAISKSKVSAGRLVIPVILIKHEDKAVRTRPTSCCIIEADLKGPINHILEPNTTDLTIFILGEDCITICSIKKCITRISPISRI